MIELLHKIGEFFHRLFLAAMIALDGEDHSG